MRTGPRPILRDLACRDYASDVLCRLGVGLLYPGHVAKNLTNHPVVTTRYLKFYNDEPSFSVQSENVDKSAANRKFDARDAFVLIQFQAKLNERQVLGEKIS